MQFYYSYHWFKKRKYRQDIKEYMIEYTIINSGRLKDKYWEDAFNAISKIPPSGRTLKVVYKIKGKSIKIITAYWLE